MAKILDLGGVVIDADEVISVEDSVEVKRTSWYHATRRQCVTVTFKNGTSIRYYTFTKDDFICALKGQP